jgi:hypothetical protein
MGTNPTRRVGGSESVPSTPPTIAKEKVKIDKVRAEKISPTKPASIKFKAAQTTSEEPFSPAAAVFYRPRMVSLAKRTPLPRQGRTETKDHEFSKELPESGKQITDKLSGPLKRALPQAA